MDAFYTRLSAVLDPLLDALGSWTTRQIDPLSVRLATHSHRADVLEDRIVALGAQRKAAAGPRGEIGPQGKVGPRGPRPEHEWRETELRFEKADGKWGEWADLRGPSGRVGGLTAMGLPIGSGGGGGTSTSTTTTGFSYFPSGWS